MAWQLLQIFAGSRVCTLTPDGNYKKMSPYFFIGFILAAYLSMPTIAVTLLGIMFVLVMVTSQNNQLAAEENAGGDENEF